MDRISKSKLSETRATIRDVARESGVALSTVSNALLGKQHVREETRQQIQAVANRLGYRPSTVARALRHQRSFSVGVLVPDIANPAYPEVLRGIEDVLSADTWAVFLCSTDDNLDRELKYLRHMLDRQVDGFILVSQHLDSPAVLDLLRVGPPAVLVHRRSQTRDMDYVGADNHDSMRQVVRYLTGIGHRRIGFIRGPVSSSTAAERQGGFLTAIAEAGLQQDDRLIVPGDYTFDAGVIAGGRLLDLQERPSAIMASNDLAALGVLRAADARGIAVPRDLSIVGIDDIYLSALPPICLTTIRLPKRIIGAEAARLLLQRIREPGADYPPRQRIFHADLVIRQTTAPQAATIDMHRQRGD